MNGCLIMQVLKNDVRNNILLSGADEFYRFGYKDASIRRIANDAGVTPGNIYAYFRSKETLFSGVLAETLKELNEFVKQTQRKNFNIQNLTEEITNIFLRNKKQFLILMNGSKGTQFENIKQELCELVSIRIETEYLPNLRIDDRRTDSLVSDAFATAIIEGMCHLFNSFTDDVEELMNSISCFITVIFEPKYPNNEDHA